MIVNPLDLALFGGPVVRADAGHSRGNWQAKRASKQRQRSLAHQTGRQPNDKYKRYNVQGTPQSKKIGLRMMGEREDAEGMTRRGFLAAGAAGAAGYGATHLAGQPKKTGFQDERPRWSESALVRHQKKATRHIDVSDKRMPTDINKIPWKHGYGTRGDDFSDEHPLKSLRNHGWGHVGRGMHRNPAHRGHTIQFNTGVGKPASYEHKNETGSRIGGGHAKTLGSHLKWFSGLHRGDAGMGSSPPSSSRRKPDPLAQFSKSHAQHQQKKKRFAPLQKRIGHRQETVPAGLRG